MRLLVIVLLVLAGLSWWARQWESEAPAASGDIEAAREAELDLAEGSADPPAPPVADQAPAPPESRRLLTLVGAPANAAAIEASVGAPTRETRYARLAPAVVAGKSAVFWEPAGSRFTMATPEGDPLEIELASTRANGPDRWVSHGRVVGFPDSRAWLAFNRGQLVASIEGMPGGEITVQSVGDLGDDDLVQLYRVAHDLVGECGAGPQQAVNAEAWTGSLTAAAGARLAADEPLVSGQAVVDLLMAYTTAAKDRVGGANVMGAQIDLGIAKLNDDFANSGITARIRLAGTSELDYPDDNLAGTSGWQSTTLERLYRVTDGYLDEIHAERDAVGADLVCLLLRRPDTGSNGIAYIMEDPGLFTEPFFAFAVVQSSLVSSSVVLTHEIGHLLGCAHAHGDPGATGTKDGAYAYSYGYKWTAVDNRGETLPLRSIMAYAPGQRIPYFSSPNLRPASLVLSDGTHAFVDPPATGIAAGAVNAADNARTIEETAFQVANFRLSPTRSAAGRMVNVSTRSFVGSGDQALTGGFVVSGAGTKRVLVRAAGPALAAAPFHVPDTLSDAFLEVVQLGGSLVAANNDWELPATNGVAVATTGQAVGAFPFFAGGRDAALVADLEPGAYTAVVSGVAGATGNALVEAYEVSSTGNTRMLNLSTRAYATTANPIVAGFVVERDPAAPDKRKTMFIRVRGPSLVDFGLAYGAVMPDPAMEIYAADAQLVLLNDDWDPPTADLDGTAVDFVPLLHRGEVDQLSEQAVFEAASRFDATFSMRPVEPGVVVEMPPGLYTVIVRPFEDLPLEPAVPGVAIVEVFELVD